MRLSPKTLLVTSAVSIAAVTSAITLSPAVVRSFSDTPKQTPTRIVIERASIDLPIQLGSYDTGNSEWQIDSTNAFFASTTKRLNSRSGNTLIYAHNYPHLFAGTLTLVSGDIIKIYAADTLYTYTVERAQDVSPKDTSVFTYGGKPQLVLLTCSGPNDITRRLTYAKLKSTQPSTENQLAASR